MIISALKSNDSRDSRSPIHIDTISALTDLGAEILFEDNILLPFRNISQNVSKP